LHKEEMETILRYDAMDDCWYAWSVIPKHIKTMKSKEWTVIFENEIGAYLKAPPCGVRIGKASPQARKPMSDEQKESMRKRLNEVRHLKNIER